MPIRFSCENPQCGRRMKAPDGTAGRKARCPACGTIQVIPSPEAAGVDPGASAADDGMAALARGETFGLPPAGPAPAVAAVPSAPPIDEARRGGSIGALAADCFRALLYGLSNFRSLVKLVLYSIALLVLIQIAMFLVGVFTFGSAGTIIVSVVSLCGQLVIGGYFLRYYLDCIISSLEGVDTAPDVPSFEFGPLFLTGLRGLAVYLVYGGAIVVGLVVLQSGRRTVGAVLILLGLGTLWMLPVACLAMGYLSGAGPLNVVRVARAAVRAPLGLLVLWALLLLWSAAMVVALVALWAAIFIYLVAIVALTGWLVMLLGALVAGVLLGAVFHMFMAVQFRCIGMYGRHFPAVLHALEA